MRKDFMREFLGLFIISFCFFMITGCEGDDHGETRLCLDNDGDGYGVIYDSIIAPLRLPLIPCSEAVDVDDNDPNIWVSGFEPVIISSAPNSVNEGEPYSYDITCIDEDASPNLSLAFGPLDSCGGLLIDNDDGTGNYSFSPDESLGPSQCVVEITCTDTQPDIQQSHTQTTTVNIEEVNQAPAWISPPGHLEVFANETYNTINGQASDADEPSQNLSCEKSSSDCSFTVNVSGSDTVTVGCNIEVLASGSQELCSVSITVSDEYGATISGNFTIASHASCIIFADDDAAGAGTGGSWGNAFTHPQYAVNRAFAGCEVWVAEGNYYRPSGAGTGSVLYMKQNVDIYGGFNGTEATLAERGNPSDYPATLDGELQSNNVVRAVSDSTLDGFIIRGGYVTSSWGFESGGGINIDTKNNVTISNSILRENTAHNMLGGAIYSLGSSNVTIMDCIFSSNHADTYGGAIVLYNSSATITNCLFIGNSAWIGGGIQFINAVCSLSNCTFNANTATQQGGALSTENSTITITNSILWGNSAPTGPEIHIYSVPNPSISYSNIAGSDPLFVTGTYGDHYLSQTAAGQGADSPCVDTGSDTAANLGLNNMTTRTDDVQDGGTVDMGYHNPLP
jgi:predicted outer membrane repeat protein